MEIFPPQLPASTVDACAGGAAEDAMDTTSDARMNAAGHSGYGSRDSNMAVDSDTLTDESDDEVPTSRSESELSFLMMDTLRTQGNMTSYCDSNQPNFNSGIYKNLRVRKSRRPMQEKIRHKRQTLRDMTKPLKQWLYLNKDNPYPNKADKMTLALNSQMTLTQVSNWFANARRRLKNTVTEPDLSWSKRIKRYNSHANGNQELLSISSGSEEDSDDDKTEKELDLNTKGNVETSGLHTTTGISQHLPKVQQEDAPESAHALALCAKPTPNLGPENTFKTVSTTEGGNLLPSTTEHAQKFSQTILSRYLNDQQSVQLSMSRDGTRHRNASGSLSSHDFEDLSSSSRSTPIREQLLSDDCMEEYEEFSRHWPDKINRSEDDLYWKEIGAALALTTLSRSRHNSGASSKSRFSMQ